MNAARLFDFARRIGVRRRTGERLCHFSGCSVPTPSSMLHRLPSATEIVAAAATATVFAAAARGSVGSNYADDSVDGPVCHRVKCDGGQSSSKWVHNWDGRAGSATGWEPTRHLLLVRHGQYELRDPEHPLTPLGREQSKITGRRLAAMAQNAHGLKVSPDSEAVSIRFVAVHSSNMLRARQTAEIIAYELGQQSDGSAIGEPTALLPEDPLLAEGCPCYPEPKIPGYSPPPRIVDRDGKRIEAAFQKYVHRSTSEMQRNSKGNTVQGLLDKANLNPTTASAEMEDTWEILVCHGNVIRYFVMRALQLPPEAWCRTCTFNCGVTHLVIHADGRVGLNSFGDVGHFTLDQITYH